MAQYMRQFSNIPKNDVDRVKYFLQFIELLPKSNEVKANKCEKKATAARDIGNREFVAKDYLNALKSYNEALCYAPAASEIVGIAYANRAAIYLNCGFFKLCLENIELALKNNYPERLMSILVKRKEKCMIKMKNAKDSAEIYNYVGLSKLSYPSNSKAPFMIDGLELKKNEKYGRHIITTRDLKPGDIVMIEKPFVQSYCHEKTEYIQCFYCCTSHFLNLQPCSKTTKAMFCSEKCSKDAWNEFYKYEWKIINGIVNKNMALECHTLLKAFTFFGDLTKLKAMMDLAEKDPITVFDVDFTEADEITKYRMLFSMFINRPKDRQSIITEYKRASLIYFMLKEYTDFKKVLKTQELENLFMEICVRITLIVQNNLHEFQYYWLDHASLDKYASGLFFASSLMSHSCLENVHRVCAHGQNHLVVTQPIKAGEQLFNNYGVSLRSENVVERQRYLQTHGHFTCDCQACTYESNNPFQPPSLSFFNHLPHIRQFILKFNDPLCPFDEAFSSDVVKAQKEMIEFMKSITPKNSKELAELIMMLFLSFWTKVAKKTLKVMLTPKV